MSCDIVVCFFHANAILSATIAYINCFKRENLTEMAHPVSKVCFICKLNDENQLDLGEWKQLDDIVVHYFCLVSERRFKHVHRYVISR